MSKTEALSAPDHRQQFLIGVGAGTCAAIIWGLWPVITRFGVTNDFSAEEIVVVRFVFAGVLLLPHYLKNKVYQRISPFRSIIIASGAGAIYVYVSALGLKFVPAGHLGVVETGMMLVLSALGGYFILNERKSFVQVFGYAFVFAGMLIVNWQSFSGATPLVIYGDLLLVLAGVLWAVYTVLSNKWSLNSWDAVATVSVWSLFTWVPVLIIFGSVSVTQSNIDAWLIQGISQGVLTAILGLWLYSLAVRKLGAARGSLFGALVPAVAVLGGFIFLAEVPTTIEMIGVSLTTIGITISLKR